MSNASDERLLELGQLTIKQLELFRRVKEGSVDSLQAQKGLQKIIEGKSFVIDRGELTISVDNVAASLAELVGIIRREGVFVSSKVLHLLDKKWIADFCIRNPETLTLVAQCSDDFSNSQTLGEESRKNTQLVMQYKEFSMETALKAIIQIIQRRIRLFHMGIGALVFRDFGHAERFLVLNECGGEYALSVINADERPSIFYHWVVKV